MPLEESLEERLDDYRVTALPGPAPLRLSWSLDGRSSDGQERSGTGGDDDGSLALLRAYRITRVPVRVAS